MCKSSFYSLFEVFLVIIRITDTINHDGIICLLKECFYLFYRIWTFLCVLIITGYKIANATNLELLQPVNSYIYKRKPWMFIAYWQIGGKTPTKSVFD